MAEARTGGTAAVAEAPPAGKLTSEQHVRIQQVNIRHVGRQSMGSTHKSCARLAMRNTVDNGKTGELTCAVVRTAVDCVCMLKQGSMKYQNTAVLASVVLVGDESRLQHSSSSSCVRRRKSNFGAVLVLFCLPSF